MNLNQNKFLNRSTASNMAAKVAKLIKNGRKQCRLLYDRISFFEVQIKPLGSLGKIRVGHVTGNTHIFFYCLRFILSSNGSMDLLCLQVILSQ